MFADFKLTDGGDLAIAGAEYRNPFKVSFNLSSGKGLKVTFALAGFYESLSLRENTLRISFDIEEHKMKYKMPVIEDRAFLNQYVLLRLKAIKGEIYNREKFGTKLNDLKYNSVNEDLKNRIKALVYDEFREDIKELEVKVDFITNGYRTGTRITLSDPIGIVAKYEIER